MAKRGRKLISVRKPRVRVTSKGVKVTSPSMRIGSKVGANISKEGISYSARTKRGTISTGKIGSKRNKGCSFSLPGCPLKMLAIGLLVFLLIKMLTWHHPPLH